MGIVSNDIFSRITSTTLSTFAFQTSTPTLTRFPVSLWPRRTSPACSRQPFSQDFSPIFVPDQILVAFIAKLTLYEFRCDKGQFAELLKVLEKDDAAPVVVAVSRN